MASQDSLNVLEDLTIEVFVQVDKVGTPMALVTKGSAVGGGREGVPHQLGILADGRVEFAFAEADGKPSGTSPTGPSGPAPSSGSAWCASAARPRCPPPPAPRRPRPASPTRRSASASTARSPAPTSTAARARGPTTTTWRWAGSCAASCARCGCGVPHGPSPRSASRSRCARRGCWHAGPSRRTPATPPWTPPAPSRQAARSRWTRDVDPAASPLRLYCRNGEPLLATTAPTPADLLPYGDPQLTLGARLEGASPPSC